MSVLDNITYELWFANPNYREWKWESEYFTTEKEADTRAKELLTEGYDEVELITSLYKDPGGSQTLATKTYKNTYFEGMRWPIYG